MNSSPKSVILTAFTAFGLVVLIVVVYLRVYLEHHDAHGISSSITATDHYSSGIKIFYDALSCKASYCNVNHRVPQGRDLIGYYGASLQYQYTFPIHRSREVQLLFDQGMLQQHGFNVVESARNFDAAIREDPLCAMCYWGLALSKVANINSESNEADARAGSKAIHRALELINTYPKDYGKLEQRLVQAISEVFPKEDEVWSLEIQKTLNQNYINAMRVLYKDYPRNIDIKTFYAESLINTSPWEYYEADRSTLLPNIAIANQALEEALTLSEYKHPLALHLYTHVTEQSLYPAKGKLAADSLSSIAGSEGSGHLSHMPSHTYFRIGSYDECIRSSLRAVEVDTFYASKCLTTYFPMHNMALLVSCALSSGQLEVALEHSFDLAHTDNFLANYGHELFPYPKEVLLAQFGRWQDLSSMMGLGLSHAQGESGRELYQSSIAERPIFIQMIAQYARVLTRINLGSKYDEDLEQLSELVHSIPIDKQPADHYLYPYHRELGYLFNATAFASAAVSSGNILLAASIMKDAATLLESFKYMEPEYFYHPIRQCLAAAELAAARSSSISKEERFMYLERAYESYLHDLRDHPKNGWSVFGLIQTMREKELQLGGKGIHQRSLRGDMVWNSTISWRDMSIPDLEELYHHTWKFGGKPISGSCCELGLC
jgi:hypothetical protein